jgi:hypothetical protein
MYCELLRCFRSSPIDTVTGSSLVASPGKLRLAPGPCTLTVTQSYALAASSSEEKYPMCLSVDASAAPPSKIRACPR